MLVEVGLSVWTANKLDKNATNKVLVDNDAGKGAAQVRKNLMAGTGLRKEIADYAANVRTWYVGQTLPWMDRGARLLAGSLFMDFNSELKAKQDKFQKMKHEFIKVYPQLLQVAQNYQGHLFNPQDYPHPDELYDKFDFRATFTPIPEASDFRLDVAEEELAELKVQYENTYESRINLAMQDTWARLHTVLTNMSAKLTDVTNPDGTVQDKRYHKTLVTNATELCSMLTHLNITNDSKLELARQDLERVMVNADIDTLKEVPEVRKDMKSKLDNILKQYEW
jgi:hypothetical protein|tara:strand:- start:634 stop:1476 length:843 start_codon:yes stop_codon:yes gene_type:complete